MSFLYCTLICIDFWFSRLKFPSTTTPHHKQVMFCIQLSRALLLGTLGIRRRICSTSLYSTRWRKPRMSVSVSAPAPSSCLPVEPAPVPLPIVATIQVDVDEQLLQPRQKKVFANIACDLKEQLGASTLDSPLLLTTTDDEQ